MEKYHNKGMSYLLKPTPCNVLSSTRLKNRYLMSNLKESCNLEIKNRNLKSFELCNLQRFIVFFKKKQLDKLREATKHLYYFLEGTKNLIIIQRKVHIRNKAINQKVHIRNEAMCEFGEYKSTKSNMSNHSEYCL